MRSFVKSLAHASIAGCLLTSVAQGCSGTLAVGREMEGGIEGGPVGEAGLPCCQVGQAWGATPGGSCWHCCPGLSESLPLGPGVQEVVCEPDVDAGTGQPPPHVEGGVGGEAGVALGCCPAGAQWSAASSVGNTCAGCCPDLVVRQVPGQSSELTCVSPQGQDAGTVGPPCTTQADCTGDTACAQPAYACGAQAYCVPGELPGPCNSFVAYCSCANTLLGAQCPVLPEGYVPPGGAYWGGCVDLDGGMPPPAVDAGGAVDTGAGVVSEAGVGCGPSCDPATSFCEVDYGPPQSVPVVACHPLGSLACDPPPTCGCVSGADCTCYTDAGSGSTETCGCKTGGTFCSCAFDGTFNGPVVTCAYHP